MIKRLKDAGVDELASARLVNFYWEKSIRRFKIE